MRIRVFAGVALAAAVLGLAGCRADPDIAAYVGDQTLTEARVTELISGYVTWADKRAEEQAKQTGLEKEKVPTPDRTVVVNYLVRGAICEEARKKLGFTITTPNLPEGQSDLAKIASQVQACEEARPTGEAVTPTEADARKIFDIGVANGVWQPEQAAQVLPGLMNDQDVAGALSRKKTLEKALAGINITVNPKYGAVEVPLASFQGGIPAISLTFGESGPVTNRPVEPSPPAKQNQT